jgi:hypothetical protein
LNAQALNTHPELSKFIWNIYVVYSM